jgi:hypothetical protein
LATKIREILEPHISGHPITYNHYLTETVQKLQANRNRRELEKRLKGFFNQDVDSTERYLYVNLESLFDTLILHTKPNMDKFFCSLATDMMEAYHKISSFFLIFA